jgi:hypothetical protein
MHGTFTYTISYTKQKIEFYYILQKNDNIVLNIKSSTAKYIASSGLLLA